MGSRGGRHSSLHGRGQRAGYWIVSEGCALLSAYVEYTDEPLNHRGQVPVADTTPCDMFLPSHREMAARHVFPGEREC